MRNTTELRALLGAALGLAFAAGAVLADGSHDHGAAPMPGMAMEGMAMEGMAGHEMSALGMPATAAAAATARSVTVVMRETEAGEMLFEPARLDVAAGETVRLILQNAGAQEHEFVMDSPEEIAAHKQMMAEMPDMVHAAPNALRLAPGASGEIDWTFGAAGRFEFACLLPGHSEAGMRGPLVVR